MKTHEAIDGAAIQFAFENIFDAYKRTIDLQSVTNAIQARRQAQNIEKELELGISKLVSLNPGCEERWNAIRANLSAKIVDRD